MDKEPLLPKAMLPDLPNYIAITFGSTTLLMLGFFIRAIRHADSERTRRLAVPAQQR